MKKYFINLDNRQDRLESVLNDEFLMDFQRVSAIHSSEINLDEYKLKPDITYITPAEAGCCLSHIKVWEIATKDPTIKNSEFIMVCEDDVSSVKNFNEILEKLIHFSSYTENDFIHCIPTQDLLNKYDWNNVPIKEITLLTTGCYLIRKSLCIKLVEQFKANKELFIADKFFSYLPFSVVSIFTPIVEFNSLSQLSDISEERIKKFIEFLSKTNISS